MKHRSLGRRLLLAACAATVVFLGATGMALDLAFRSSLQQAERERLRNHVYTVLAGARLEGEGLTVPAALPDARFGDPGSGLYGRVLDRDGNVLWRSGSLDGLQWSGTAALPPGRLRYGQTTLNRDSARTLAYGVRWSGPGAGSGRFTVEIAESRLDSRAQLAAFRRTLWGWLGAAGIGLLATQLLLHYWGLHPLRRTVRELQDIRRGRRDYLGDDTPEELAPLARGINRLLDAERERRRQYQNSLADLAHSLKTPLAVLRGALAAGADAGQQQEALDQVDRIDTSVRYHLARAGRSRERFGQSTPLRPAAERLLRTVAARRQPLPELALECPEALRFPGPEDELMEILGNVLDNAARHCSGWIRLQALADGDDRTLTMIIDDDGPGIAPGERDHVLQRGGHGSSGPHGTGMGLAIVAELVAAYDGTMAIETAATGGARIRLTFPLPR